MFKVTTQRINPCYIALMIITINLIFINVFYNSVYCFTMSGMNFSQEKVGKIVFRAIEINKLKQQANANSDPQLQAVVERLKREQEEDTHPRSRRPRGCRGGGKK